MVSSHSQIIALSSPPFPFKAKLSEHLSLLLNLNRRRLPNLRILDILSSNHMSSRQLVQSVIIRIKRSILEPENRSTNKRKHSHDTIIPDQQGVSAQADERLADSSGNGRHEESESLNERSHVLWCFTERILERGDGGEDFRNGDQHVGASLGPDVDVDGRASSVSITAEGCREGTSGVLATDGFLVDVGLDDGGPDHGSGTGVETCGDLLNGCEVDLRFAHCGVDEQITDWDEDDECERV